VRGNSQPPDALDWERECLRRAQGGDREAFAQLYRAFAPRLYAQVLMPRLGQRQAAEDALSETFRMLLERSADLDADGRSLYAWLARVATNKALDMHRVRTRSARALANFEGLIAPLREGAESADAVERDATRGRVRETVDQVLTALNPRYRRAIELRFLEEQPRELCAARMEVKLGTFDVVLLRALRAFRVEWESRHG